MSDDRPQIPLAHRHSAIDGLEEEHLLLDIGRKQREVHELGDPGPGELEVAGGLVA
jgi:hypothetical protein